MTSLGSDRIQLPIEDLTDPRVAGLFDCILAIDVLEHIEDDNKAAIISPGAYNVEEVSSLALQVIRRIGYP